MGRENVRSDPISEYFSVAKPTTEFCSQIQAMKNLESVASQRFQDFSYGSFAINWTSYKAKEFLERLASQAFLKIPWLELD